AVGAVEALENVRLRFGWYPCARVCDSHEVVRAVARQLDANLAARRRELDRVVEQVEDHPPDQSLVAAQWHLVVRMFVLKLDASPRGERADGAHAFARRLVEIEARACELVLSRVGAR